MAIFKEILPNDIKTSRSFLSQLIDVLQEDVSSSVSRRKYQVFVTGGVGPGITSSLYQTVYDQDFTLQTANPVFDMTFGIRPDSSLAQNSKVGEDETTKELFPSSSLMMREKLDVYRQFSQNLLGDEASSFRAPFDSNITSDIIDSALFISFRRLFSRDQIKRETFAMKFFQSASAISTVSGQEYVHPALPANGKQNLYAPSSVGAAIFTDMGSSTNKLSSFGGQVGNIVDSANTSKTVGLVFYDRGIVVLDVAKITQADQLMSGTISAMSLAGVTVLGGPGTETEEVAKLIPDFVVSGSIDNIVDHFGYSRFGSGVQSAFTFQNVTNINSTLIFCRASADEFNYSSNATFTDSDDRIVVIDPGQDDLQQTFTYITSVGLYDANDNLLAVAKLSRPVEKSPERDLTLRVRLDF